MVAAFLPALKRPGLLPRLDDTVVEREISHYEAETSESKDLRPGDAFHIARIIEAAPDDNAAIALAKAAVERIPEGSIRCPQTS